ncbi:MAG: regulatory protein RecX [Ruminococcaceae bacterium]|nr:regulatory protein RecX [Oscillospiraceae bacterium]
MISIRDYALYLIEFKDRTEKELRDKFREKGYEENSVEDEIEFLKNYGYIDDVRYAEHFINDAINLKKWGKIRIRTELSRKGIDREIIYNAIEDAFAELDDDRVLSQMQIRFKNSDFSNIKERTRIFNFFMRRGFSPDEIKGAMNKMCSFDDIICDE